MAISSYLKNLAYQAIQTQKGNLEKIPLEAPGFFISTKNNPLENEIVLDELTFNGKDFFIIHNIGETVL